MSRPIKEGDTITAIWSFLHEDEIVDGIVLSMPCAVGDLLYVEDEYGNVHGINTTCHTFSGIVKRTTTGYIESA